MGRGAVTRRPERRRARRFMAQIGSVPATSGWSCCPLVRTKLTVHHCYLLTGSTTKTRQQQQQPQQQQQQQQQQHSNKSKARARKNVLFYYSCVKDVVRVSQPLLILLFFFSYFELKNCFGRRSTFFYGFNCVSSCLDSSWGFVDGFLLSSSVFAKRREMTFVSFRFSPTRGQKRTHTIFFNTTTNAKREKELSLIHI